MDDEPFKYVLMYIEEKGLIQHDNNLRCGIKKKGKTCWTEEIFKVKDEKAKPEVEFQTGAGSHIVRYKGKKIWIHHSIHKTILTGWDN